MDTSKHIVLVDLSSYIFYRYYAIQRWIALSGKEKDSFSIEQIISQFSRLFQSNLKDIVKKLKVDWNNVILARDCPRKQIWRLASYPDYKKSRDAKTPTFEPAIFGHAYNELIPRMIEQHKISMLQYENAEADDVIAILHRKLRTTYPTVPITILSMDSDFIQLHDKYTNIFTFLLKDLTAPVPIDRIGKYLLWKIIKGDDSDNIPAIDKRIGPATAWSLALNDKLLEEKLNSNEVVKKNYERNSLLINFDNIPLNIRIAVEQMI